MEIVARENSVTVIDHHTRQRTTTEEPDPMEVPVLEVDLKLESMHLSETSIAQG